MTPTKIQRFIIFLQKYKFIVNFVPSLIKSDTLSRAPLKEQSPEISETEGNNQVISRFPIRTKRIKQLEIETLNDKTLQRVTSYTTQG